MGLPSIGSLGVNSSFGANQIGNLTAWYRADAIAGIPDGLGLSTWGDSSGNGYTASGSSVKPIYNTNVLNGYPAITWDGVANKYFTLPFTLTQPFTIFLVGKQTSAANPTVFLEAVPSSNRIKFSVNLLGQFSIFGGGAGDQTDSFVWTGAFHLFVATFNGTSTNGWVDGQNTLINVDNGTNGYQNGFIGSDGGAQSMIGQIAEILFFSSVVSDIDRGKVERYLRTKYNL